MEWCIRQLWCSLILAYNITSIAHNHYTDIYPLLIFIYSATFPPEIQKLAEKYLRPYVKVEVGRVGSTTSSITQRILQTTSNKNDKQDLLFRVLEAEGALLTQVRIDILILSLLSLTLINSSNSHNSLSLINEYCMLHATCCCVSVHVRLPAIIKHKSSIMIYQELTVFLILPTSFLPFNTEYNRIRAKETHCYSAH